MGRKKGEREKFRMSGEEERGKDRVWNRWGGRNGKEESWEGKSGKEVGRKVEKVKRKGERDVRE